MRILTSVVFALLLVACQTSAAGNRVDGPQAQKLVSSGATLLDVRTPQEYQRGHLDGAKLVPLSTLESRLSELPKDKPVVVYCQSGNRSAQASNILKANGYEVHDLGAMRNW
jgi:rhodanese-related sulfurtransferase